MTMTRRNERSIVPLRTAIQQLMGDWPYVPVDGGLTELAPPIDAGSSRATGSTGSGTTSRTNGPASADKS